MAHGERAGEEGSWDRGTRGSSHKANGTERVDYIGKAAQTLDWRARSARLEGPGMYCPRNVRDPPKPDRS